MSNLAAADGSIGCWNDKYYWWFWRPIDAIRGADNPGGILRIAGEFRDVAGEASHRTHDHPLQGEIDQSRRDDGDEQGQEQDVIQAFRLGAADYLLWPARDAEVVSVVERVLQHVHEQHDRQRDDERDRVPLAEPPDSAENALVDARLARIP